MKITHISYSDTNGGASIAAFRLHNAMQSLGITSHLLVLQKSGDFKSVKQINTRTNLIRTLYLILKNKFNNIIYKNKKVYSKGAFSQNNNGYDISNDILLNQSDIIYIHWINRNMLSIKNIESILKLQKPTFWFMHDMWAITGGCHHSFDCNKYQTHCCYCPNIYSNKKKDISYKIFRLKENKLKKYKNLYFITPSKWLNQCIQKSSIFKNHNVTTIPNLVETEIFKPTDKHFARKVLGINTNKHLLLFGAGGGINNPYKGWSYLMRALNYLDKNKYEIIIFGNNLTQKENDEIPIKVYSLGTLTDKYSIILAYNAADVFIIPSIAENFPQTILESMSCGLPVVGFNVGGIPDIIKHKENGYLAQYRNDKDLAEGIKWILKDNNHYKMISLIARNYSLSYSPDIVVNKHTELWKKLLQ